MKNHEKFMQDFMDRAGISEKDLPSGEGGHNPATPINISLTPIDAAVLITSAEGFKQLLEDKVPLDSENAAEKLTLVRAIAVSVSRLRLAMDHALFERGVKGI